MKTSQNLTTSQTAALLLILSVGSKPLGLIRELVFANYYGTSYVADAYVMASGIPGTLVAAIFSAIGVAFMPLLTEHDVNEGPQEANRFTSKIINIMFLVSIVIAVLGIIFAGPLTTLFAPGYLAETRELTIRYLKVAFVSLIGTAVTSIMEPFLQYRGRQLVTPILGYVQDIAIITAILISAKFDIYLLIFGIVMSAILRAIIAWIYAYATDYHYSLDIHIKDDMSKILSLAIPVFIGSSAGQINVIIDRMLASSLEAGSVAALNYANLIVNTIYTLTAALLMNIIYPKLNVAFATNDIEKTSELSQKSIDLYACLSVPITLGGVIFAGPLIRVIFERGAFVGVGIGLTAHAFTYYILGLIFMSIGLVLNNLFYSIHDTKTPLKCGLVAIAVNIAFNLALVRPMGVGGLALATSLSRATNTMLLLVMLKKKHPGIRPYRSKRKLLRICIFSVIAVGAAWLVFNPLSRTGINEMWTLLVAIAAAGVVYLGLMIVAKFEELELIKDIFNRGK